MLFIEARFSVLFLGYYVYTLPPPPPPPLLPPSPVLRREKGCRMRLMSWYTRFCRHLDFFLLILLLKLSLLVAAATGPANSHGVQGTAPSPSPNSMQYNH